MKKLYKEQKHSLYEIQKEIGVSKITLYNYANKKRKIDKKIFLWQFLTRG